MLLLTSGCTICPPKEKIVTVTVKVPVPAECKAPPVIESFSDPVKLFLPDMTIDQLIKDLRTSRVLWRDRSNKLELLLDSYRQKDQ